MAILIKRWQTPPDTIGTLRKLAKPCQTSSSTLLPTSRLIESNRYYAYSTGSLLQTAYNTSTQDSKRSARYCEWQSFLASTSAGTTMTFCPFHCNYRNTLLWLPVSQASHTRITTHLVEDFEDFKSENPSHWPHLKRNDSSSILFSWNYEFTCLSLNI